MAETTVKTPKAVTLDIMDFLDNGMLREKAFREKVEAIDWASEYKDAKVIIAGCDRVPIPTWAYLVLVAHLAPHAKRIFWGEPCSAVPVYVRPS